MASSHLQDSMRKSFVQPGPMGVKNHGIIVSILIFFKALFCGCESIIVGLDELHLCCVSFSYAFGSSY